MEQAGADGLLYRPTGLAANASPGAATLSFGNFASADYKLSEEGAVATKIADSITGATVDGTGCTPIISGVHYWELEVVRVGAKDGVWCFGVCRPGIDLNDGSDFPNREDTWMMMQDNDPSWVLLCDTCEGAGMVVDPLPKLLDGSRVGLLLDLDNGGTLTMYWKGKPCGAIAEGLVGPLLPCIALAWTGKEVKIHGTAQLPPSKAVSKPRELAREHLKLIKPPIGQGQFGKVRLQKCIFHPTNSSPSTSLRPSLIWLTVVGCCFIYVC